MGRKFDKWMDGKGPYLVMIFFVVAMFVLGASSCEITVTVTDKPDSTYVRVGK